MNRQFESRADIILSFLFRVGLAVVFVVVWAIATADGQTLDDGPVLTSPIAVTHIIGFENACPHVKGDLSIQAGDLRFRQQGRAPIQISATSIRDISIGEQDKQVGGVPMMLGKAAVPFAGGRAISLFSHKKYDSIAIEYVDENGGYHGAVFRLPKGKAELVKAVLMARGACKPPKVDAACGSSSRLVLAPNDRRWSVLVERVDPGDTAMDAAFSNAIYENVVRRLANANHFERVLRSGDRNASTVSQLLVLKTTVSKYFPGSETRRAVTTVSGATRLKVHIRLESRDGRVVMESDSEGNVRFIGDNLSATAKVANNTVKILKNTTLPPTAATTQESIAKNASESL